MIKTIVKNNPSPLVEEEKKAGGAPHPEEARLLRLEGGGAFAGLMVRDARAALLTMRRGSILGLVDQGTLLNPRHHVAELCADLLDRVLRELGAGRLERGLVDLVLQHPVAG